MSDVAIKVEGLGKSYLVGREVANAAGYTALREVVARNARSVARKSRDMLMGKPIVQGDKVEEFWALKDISFEVKEGDRVGIIGRNGAGKSTLLKIVSRITAPTAGRVTIRGRVASLLEVGTGFHGELTGRENILLNGAILGMSRHEIQKKFDEIVDFAGVGTFLDTPVKRYSSGMYVRLAFAVAAHLEPEILIVDEVLAVGDAEFQHKCLGKMREAGRNGRTVLFVSHNMSAISEMCNRAILLQKGMKAFEGESDRTIDCYLASTRRQECQKTFASSCGRFSLKKPYWIDQQGAPVSGYRHGESPTLRFEFDFREPLAKINPGIGLRDLTGRPIFISHLADDHGFQADLPLRGKVAIETEISLPLLAPGFYELSFGVRDEDERTVIYAEGEISLEITSSGPRKNGAAGVLWYTSNWRLSHATV